MIITELNNCFSNYRRCETTVKATVCSSLLGENGVIECSSQQINDMVFATWHPVLIIIGKGGLLRIVCKHRYDLMKWSQFSHFTAQDLEKSWLVWNSFLLILWANHPKKITLIRQAVPQKWPQLTLSSSVSEECSTFGDHTRPKICRVSCSFFLQGTASDLPATVFLSALLSAFRCIDISTHLGPSRWAAQTRLYIFC